MWSTRRSIATALLVTACAGLTLFYPAAMGGPTRVANADDNVRIESPVDGASVVGRIDIRVTATAADPSQIDFYRIYVGNGRSPSAMRPLGPPHTSPAVSEVLASLETSLLVAGEATIELRMYLKGADPISTTVVVNVQVGPTPTRTFSGPVIVVPPVAVGPARPAPIGGGAGAEYPVEALPDVEIPQFAQFERTPAPITQLTPDFIYDTLPGDPIQDDPLLRDVGITPIPIPTPALIPIPRLP